MKSSRVFAVIPAAGRSRRMGSPKLLLPYRGATVIASLLQTLGNPRITDRCLVCRGDDSTLAQEARLRHAAVLQPPTDPPDMRTSVELALHHISNVHHPDQQDGWLLIPADHPLVSPELLTELLMAWDSEQSEILVPTYRGRRGHPTLFRWSTVSLLSKIPVDRGLNWLLEYRAEQVTEWACDFPEAIQDLDTPDDYARLLQQEQARPSP